MPLDVTVSIPSLITIGEDNGSVQVCVMLTMAMDDTERAFAIMLMTINNGTGRIIIASIVRLR